MSDAVILAVVVLGIMGLLALGISAYNRHLTPSTDCPWELEEHSDGSWVHVYAVHPGDEKLLVGSVPWDTRDFEGEIEEVRAEGRAKLAALNSGRKFLKNNH